MFRTERFNELLNQSQQREQRERASVAAHEAAKDAVMVRDFRHILERNVEGGITKRLDIKFEVTTLGGKRQAVGRFDLHSRHRPGRWVIYALTEGLDPEWRVFKVDTDVYQSSDMETSENLQYRLLRLFDEAHHTPTHKR